MTAPQVPGDGKEGQRRCGALAPDMLRRYGPTCTLAPHNDGEHSNGTVSWHTCPAPSSAAPVTGDAQRQEAYENGRWCGECRYGVVEDPPCCFQPGDRLTGDAQPAWMSDEAWALMPEERAALAREPGDAQRALLDAADALDRVRALHQPVQPFPDEAPCCGHCTAAYVLPGAKGVTPDVPRTIRTTVLWPCPTARAAAPGSPDTGEGDT